MSRPRPPGPAPAGADDPRDSVAVLPVPGIGEVVPGTDLADVIAAAAPWLRDGDVLVVTSKIVSKAEGRVVPVPPDGPARDRARADAIAGETARVVASRGQTRIVATHHGFVMAAAGVDTSNVESSQLALLPKDPDASARALRAALAERHGVRVAVVVSDTMGRPWRNGLTDVALGAAGIAPLRDHRGETDPYGNELLLTQVAVVDELAAAAELVKGKTDQVPVAVVRGLPVGLDRDGPGVVATLVRDAAQDMFSLGTAEARAAGLRDAATLATDPLSGAGPIGPAGPPRSETSQPGDLRESGPREPVDLAAVQRAIATVAGHVAPGTTIRAEPPPGNVIHCRSPDPVDPAALVRFGGDLHRLRAALAAEGLTSALTFPADGVALVQVRRAG